MTSFLSGIRVVSLTTGIAGPNAARMLATYGAEVFKIESRAGGLDAFRSYGDNPEASPRFIEVNLDTRSVTINLKEPRGVALVRELILRSDVVMENFRPGVATRLGLEAESLRSEKPDLIYMRMPGLGSTGPLSGYGTWGPTLTAYSGFTYLWNHPGQERPVGSQGVYPDYLTGVMAPLAVVAALVDRRRTGKGALVDMAQVDAAAYLLGTTYLDAAVNHRNPQPVGNDSPSAAPHGCYRCRGEERWCVIAVETEEQWRTLCRIMGQPALSGDPRFASIDLRRKHTVELDAIVNAWTAERDPHEVMSVLQEAGVPAGAVQTGSDLAVDPQLVARGFIERVRHPVLGEIPMAGLPLHFANMAHEPFTAPPPLGTDNRYAICEILGYSAAQFAQWEAEKIVF